MYNLYYNSEYGLVNISSSEVIFILFMVDISAFRVVHDPKPKIPFKVIPKHEPDPDKMNCHDPQPDLFQPIPSESPNTLPETKKEHEMKGKLLIFYCNF